MGNREEVDYGQEILIVNGEYKDEKPK